MSGAGASAPENTGPLVVEDAGQGVRVLTLNRPRKRNAIDRRLHDALVDEFRRLDHEPGVRAAVLTGAGAAFCGGVDLADAVDAALLEERRRTGINPPGVLRGVRIPVVAAVNGACVTGGLELALACDFVVASTAARFADTHAQLGLVPSWGGTAMLAEAVGVRRAKDLALSGRFLGAEDAERWGLVTRVVEPDELLAVALQTARTIAAAPPGPVHRVLDVYDRGVGRSREERLALEREAVLGAAVDVSGPASRRRAPGA